MKEATGELNMTVVTLVAIAAVGALFYLLIWPMIQGMIVQQTCNTYGTTYKAVRGEKIENSTSGEAKVNNWMCCVDGDKSKNCVDATTGATTNPNPNPNPTE